MTEKIILATGNKYKIAEITPILNKSGIKYIPQKDLFDDDVVEDGASFLENALKKARFASLKTGLPAIADDSGLMVDVLGGKPGIYSARYSGNNGENATDSENVAKLLKDLEPYSNFKQRSATYICVVVYIKNATDEDPLIGVGRLKGDILPENRNLSGIGYDGIMWIPELVKTMADIPFEKKIEISHRTKALNAVIKQLQEK
jgi:XTP/dITP diphosphohydrolase